MNTKERNVYRALLFVTASLGCLAIVGWLGTIRSIGEMRLLHPHGISEYRDVKYPFTVEVYGYKYQGKTGDFIDDMILAYGAYEKDVLFFMRDYVRALGNPDAVFLDVGACEGQHSLFMSRLVKQVHAFEPYPPAIRRFRSLVDLNGFENIRLHEVGLGRERGTVPFFAPPEENAGTGTFVPQRKNGEERSVGSFPVVVGDEWLAPLKLASVDVVKIDVEGFEKNVLQGLSKTLGRYRPVIVLEVTHPPQGTIGSLAELQGVLPASYRVLRFKEDLDRAASGNYRLLDTDRLEQGTLCEMLVAYPKEREPLVRRERSKPVASDQRLTALAR